MAGNEAVHAFLSVKTSPAFQSVGAVLVRSSIWADNGIFGDPAVISGLAGIRIKPLDDGSDEGEAEMSDF